MSKDKLAEMMEMIFEETPFEMFPGSSELARRAMAHQRERWDQLEADASYLENTAAEWADRGDSPGAEKLRRIAKYLREECD